VQLHDAVGDVIDEVAIMADEHDGPGIDGQEAGEPLDAREV